MPHKFCLAILFCTSTVLSACASHANTYLTLTSVPSGQKWPASSTKPIAISRPDIPPEINREHFTVEAGPSTLFVAGNVTWAAPLRGMIQLVLAQNLAARLPNVRVLMPGDPVPPGGVRQVIVNIQQFIPTRQGKVSLQADWAILSPSVQSQRHGYIRLSITGGMTPADEAHTMSIALAELAERIAKQL